MDNTKKTFESGPRSGQKRVLWKTSTHTRRTVRPTSAMHVRIIRQSLPLWSLCSSVKRKTNQTLLCTQSKPHAKREQRHTSSTGAVVVHTPQSQEGRAGEIVQSEKGLPCKHVDFNPILCKTSFMQYTLVTQLCEDRNRIPSDHYLGSLTYLVSSKKV